MESYAATVRRTARPALAAFVLTCLPSSLVAAALLRGDTFPLALGQLGELLLAGLIVSVAALVVGFLVVLLYGIPVYAALVNRGWANYLTATLVGAVPLAPFVSVQVHVSELSLGLYSVGTAVITHYLVQRARRPQLPANNSSKPTPLRGAA